MDEYETQCPKCGSNLTVTFSEFKSGAQLTSNGYNPDEADVVDITDEEAFCENVDCDFQAYLHTLLVKKEK